MTYRKIPKMNTGLIKCFVDLNSGEGSLFLNGNLCPWKHILSYERLKHHILYHIWKAKKGNETSPRDALKQLICSMIKTL